MDKRERSQREKQEDVVLNKVLWWIVGAVVLEFLLLLLNRFYTHYTPSGVDLALALRVAFKVLAVALPICFVVMLAWYLSARKADKATKLPGALAMVLLALAVCAVAIALFGSSGIQFLYVAVPAVAVLALIYYLYQHEFFLVAVLCALGLAGVYVIPRTELSALAAYGCAVIIAVVLVAAAVLSRKLQSGGGVLSVGGKQVELLPKNANYALLYATCGIVAAVVAATLLLGGLTLLYGVLVAWVLIMAVYYTVRLM